MGNTINGQRQVVIGRMIINEDDESVGKQSRGSSIDTEGQMDTSPIIGRVDPGCSTTIMNWDTYQELNAFGALEVLPLRDSTSTYKFANGNSKKADGRIDILTMVNDEPTCISANVFKDKGTYFLLGLNFLRSNRVRIDYAPDGDRITCEKLGLANQMMEQDNTGVDLLYFGGEPTSKALNLARRELRIAERAKKPQWVKIAGMYCVPLPVSETRLTIRGKDESRTSKDSGQALYASNDDNDTVDEPLEEPFPLDRPQKKVDFQFDESADMASCEEVCVTPEKAMGREEVRKKQSRRCLF